MIFVPLIIFGQETDLKTLKEKDDLENYTYTLLDKFLKNPTEQNLKTITTPLWRDPKNNSENMAIVILYCNRAYYENKFETTSAAIKSYEKAWQVFEKNKLQDYDIIEFCLKPLGNLYTVLGDYDNAENTIKQYYYVANIQKNHGHKIAAVLNLSNVYLSSGKASAASELLEITVKSEKLSSSDKGLLLNNLASAYVILSNEKAEYTLKQAVKLLEKSKDQNVALSNSYRNLAVISSNKNDFETAGVYFKKAKELFFRNPSQEPRKIAKLYYDEALLFYKQRKIAETKNAISSIFTILIPGYSSGLPKQESLYTETVLLDALDLQATVSSDENQYEKALESYALSFHIEELFQSVFVYENTKIVAQVRNRKRTEKCLEIYDLLFKKDNKTTWIEKAFELSEKTKAGILKQQILNFNVVSVKEKRILEQLQNWNTVILKEQQKGKNAAISKINEAIKKQNEGMLLLKSIRSETAKLQDVNLLKDCFEKSRKDKAIVLSYFSGFENLYCFKLENQKLTLQVFDKEIYKNIFRFVSYFDTASVIANDISGYQKSAFELYKLLNLPSKSKSDNLIVIPDGLLNFVPFEALITEVSSTLNFSKMPYLLNDFRIGYASSVDFYVDEKPFSFEKETVLGVFPVFENSELELTFSKDEIQEIRKRFNGNYLEKNDATFRNFKINAAAFSILHLSTHASAGDVETPASIRFYEQEILYSELYNLNIHPDLVVLSACETGIGKLYKGEGAMSVARGFQFAGARNLLFSLWKVNDFTTSVLMADFYRNIKNGKSYFESNYRSKINYLNSDAIANAKKAPYYWSAMVYYGSLEEKSQGNYLYYFIGVFIFIVLFLIIRKFRKDNGNATGLT